MKITEKALIDNLDSFTRLGFVSIIDGKEITWEYQSNDGETFYRSQEEYEITHIWFTFGGDHFSPGHRIDAFHTRDPRRASVLEAKKVALINSDKERGM